MKRFGLILLIAIGLGMMLMGLNFAAFSAWQLGFPSRSAEQLARLKLLFWMFLGAAGVGLSVSVLSACTLWRLRKRTPKGFEVVR